MERYHIYKLGLAILFYAVYYARQTVVNGLKIDDVTSTTNTTDYRERRDSGDDNTFFYQGSDGTPGVDFPTLSYVPRTKFSCRDMEGGYYADLETDCQVFHICDEGRKLSFLCPNGTTFQQSDLICDWWFKVNCSNSPLLYEESAEVLHRENAKRKDARRLSYHGTKQGVFSNNGDYDHGKDTFGGTPAHLVTPSYRSSLKTVDNRISATTEGSIRRNYKARGDRTLESFGNGVREKNYDKNNQFSTGRIQSTFDNNLQGKSGGRDQTAFSTSTQQKASTLGQFSFSKDSHPTSSYGGFGLSNFGTNAKSEAAGQISFGSGKQVPFDRNSQQTTSIRDQNTFNANLQDNEASFGQNNFGKKTKSGAHATSGTDAQQKSGGFVDQTSFGRTSQRPTSERNQNTFSTNLQGSGASFGQNSFGVNVQGKSEIDKQTTFGTGPQHQVDNSVPFDTSSQTSTSRRNHNTFGSSFHGTGVSFGQSSSGTHLQEKSKLEKNADFGTNTQHQIDDSSGQTPYDTSSLHTTSEHGQNTFGARLQGGISKPEQIDFGVNLQEKAEPTEFAFGANDQRNSGGSASQVPLYRSSQKASGRDQNLFGRGQATFGTSIQTAGGNAGQITVNRNSQKASGLDQNVFNGAQVAFGTSTQQTASGSAGQLLLDGSSQKASEHDQNIFNRGQVKFGVSTQPTVGASSGQFLLDKSLQTTNGRESNIFGSGKITFGTNIQQTTGGNAAQIPLDRSSQNNGGQDQSRFGSGQVTFNANTQQTTDSSAGQISLDRSSQNNGGQDQSRFGSGQVTFNANTQQTTDSSAGQISLDRSSQKINGRDQNRFGSGQVTFSTNIQQTEESSVGQVPLHRTSQKTAESDQNRFGINLQEKTAGSGQNGFDITLQEKTVAHTDDKFDISTQQNTGIKNKFDLNLNSQPGNGQFNVFGTSPGIHSHRDGGVDKIKFSISSHGKSDVFDANKQQNGGEYQQNIFGANGQNQLTERGQTTVSRGSEVTLGGFGQNRFDLNLQEKSRKFEQTTSSLGLKSSGSTQNRFSFTSEKEEQDDDGGKIPVLIVSAETQEPQESASFVKSGRNNLLDNNKQTTINAYPNHRDTYTAIKDFRPYYQQPQSKLPEKPFYGSSVSPQVLSTVPVSAYDGSSRTTTEFSARSKNIGPSFGFKTDISTKQPSVDVDATTFRGSSHGTNVAPTTFAPFRDAGEFLTGRSPVTTNRFSFGLNAPQTTKSSFGLNLDTQHSDVSTNREISSFGQTTTQPTTKSATIGSNKVDVTTYDRGYTNGVDVSLNSISSTLSPDILDDIEGKSTVYPGSQRSKYYDEKSSTPAVGINRFGFDSIRTTEQPYTNSPIIKLNIFPSTSSPDFESSSRFGKAFNIDSPKTQVIKLDDSKTKDDSKGSFEATGNARGGGSTLRVTIGSGQQELTGKPIIKEFTSSSQTVSPGSIKVKTNGNRFRVVTGINISPSVTFSKFGGSTAGTGVSSRTSSTIVNGYKSNFLTSTPSTKETLRGGEAIGININNRPYAFPATERDHFEVTSAGEKVGSGISITTRATPIEAETLGFTINDEIFTTPASATSEIIDVNINNENRSIPASEFSVTRQDKLGITTTTATSSRDESSSNIPYTSTSSILQPKPFSVFTTETLFDSSKIGDTDKTLFEQSGTSQLPPYKVSSASPFATTSKPSDDFELKTVSSTLPTPFTTESELYSYKPTDENINNMINTLMEVVRQRFGGKDIGFGTPRPGLVVPPSAGPQTLHTLAIYFANALDNLTSSSPREQAKVSDEESETDSPIIHIDNEELIKSLLTQMTLNNYEDLFREKDATTTELPFSLRTGADDNENDLIREDTKHPTEGPGVRQLARVFTEALSAYLEDPDTFKKVLHDVRPTEPPQITFGNETADAEDDEVLNYSDSDLKSDHPHLPVRPTGIPVSPTWGYILAFNQSSPSSDNLELRNSLSSDSENLQSADSQSFVSQLNKVTQDFKTTLSLGGTRGTTEASHTDSKNKDTAKGLPQNHWTASSDVAKLWQTTLSINPALLNENFDSSQTAQGFTSSDIDTQFTAVTSSEENSENSGETTRVSEIQYELRALPKIELNSTQVHGILIDFMNASKAEGSGKLQRILHKLNISQDEFLNKMKEIEGNPLTRRLILLLISECNTDKNKELETRSVSSDSVFELAQSKINSDNTEQPTVTSRHLSSADDDVTTESNSFKHIVHPSLHDDDEDTRALELLNSLYVIASKFGK